MTPAPSNRTKRDELRIGGSARVANEPPERPSSDDEAIDAAIKRSIDKFGA